MAANPVKAEELNGSAQLVALTLQACRIAKSAVAHAADALARRSSAPLAAVNDCEKELDRLDREIDDAVTQAVTQVSADQARELLACMKCMIDLERIGDLVSSFGARAEAIGPRVEMDDVGELLRMATALEQMLADAHDAFAARDVQHALKVLRADAEIDRLRNLLFIRHVENREASAGREGVQVLFMAQALERAGDHAKNFAEEVCHLASGRSVRHLLQEKTRSAEQMYLDCMRDKHQAARRK